LNDTDRHADAAAAALAGGSQKYRDRIAAQGKLLVRERVAYASNKDRFFSDRRHGVPPV